MADSSILSAYPAYDLPADIPGYDLDPKELERMKYLGLMRFGLGLAGRERLGIAAGAGINTMIEGQTNARREMLARLQAYAKAQEIAAARQKQAEREALVKQLQTAPQIGSPNTAVMGAGGPTPSNAQAVAAAGPITQYQRLIAQGQMLADRGMGEEAKRYFDSAKELRAKWSATAVPVRDPSGQVRFAQFSETEQPRIAEGVTPAEKLVSVKTGQQEFGVDPYTFQRPAGTPAYQTELSPEGRISAGNLSLARQRFEWEKGGGSPAEKEAFSRANTLRDEFTKQAQPFITVRDAQRRVTSAYESAKTDQSGAADVALLYGYMKVLDPGSTVREGEVATAQQTGGIPGWVVSKYNQALNGQTLSPSMRDNIVKASVGVYKKQESSHRHTEAQYEALAKRNKIDPANVIVNFRLAGDEADPTLTEAQKKAAAILERDRKR